MRRLLLLFALAACSASSGCSMMLSGVRTLVLEPLHYCAPKDAFFTSIRDRKVAEDAWKDIVSKTPDVEYSEHYADGFVDGYCDYLFLGGAGNPPPVPPRRYWKRKFETPEGHLAIGQWYDGFAHGASAAQASGLRQLVTVPSSMGPVPGPMIGPAPMPSSVVPPSKLPPPVEEVPLPATARAGSQGVQAAGFAQPLGVPWGPNVPGPSRLPEPPPQGIPTALPVPNQVPQPVTPAAAYPVTGVPFNGQRLQPIESARSMQGPGGPGQTPPFQAVPPPVPPQLAVNNVPITPLPTLQQQQQQWDAPQGVQLGPWSGPRTYRQMRDRAPVDNQVFQN